MIKRKMLVLILAASLLAGCSARAPLIRLDAEDQFNLGKGLYDRGKYAEAAEAFRRLVFEHPGSAKVDEGQLLLAMCFYNMKDYPQAEAEFRHFLLNHPDSPHADDAAYHVGMTHYVQMPAHHHDQSETAKALDSFERFLVKYPDSELVPEAKTRIAECRDRLAEKEFQNGRLYMKLGKRGPACIYFEYVTSEYPETRWSKRAEGLLAECRKNLGSAEEDTSQTKK